jgi:hypothetical protein
MFLDNNSIKMYKSISRCASCNLIINLSSGKNIYRSCDAYVCSPMCSQRRLRKISSSDPNFTNPYNWQKQNLTLPIKKSKSSINIINDYEYPEELSFEPYIHNTCYSKTLIEEKEIEEEHWNIVTGVATLVCGFIVFALIGF